MTGHPRFTRGRHASHASELLAVLSAVTSRAMEGSACSEVVRLASELMPACTGVHCCSVVSLFDPAPVGPFLRVSFGTRHGDEQLELQVRSPRFLTPDLTSFAVAVAALAGRICAPTARVSAGLDPVAIDPLTVDEFLTATRRFLHRGNDGV